jgi:hypothetical protein
MDVCKPKGASQLLPAALLKNMLPPSTMNFTILFPVVSADK